MGKIVVVDRFYIVLFSAFEQTHCARMWFYMSDQLFMARFSLKISTEVVYLQRWHGWCHMKLLPSRHVLCTPYNHAPCHFMQSHIRKVHTCLAVTCHLHFWQNDRDLLRATAVTRCGTDTKIRVSTESWPWRRNFSRRSCRDSNLNPQPFNHESCALITDLFPLPAQRWPQSLCSSCI